MRTYVHALHIKQSIAQCWLFSPSTDGGGQSVRWMILLWAIWAHMLCIHRARCFVSLHTHERRLNTLTHTHPHQLTPNTHTHYHTCPRLWTRPLYPPWTRFSCEPNSSQPVACLSCGFTVCVCLIRGGSFKEKRWLRPRFGRLTYLSLSCQFLGGPPTRWKPLSRKSGSCLGQWEPLSLHLLWTCWPASWMPHYLEAVMHQPTPFVSTHILKHITHSSITTHILPIVHLHTALYRYVHYIQL